MGHQNHIIIFVRQAVRRASQNSPPHPGTARRRPGSIAVPRRPRAVLRCRPSGDGSHGSWDVPRPARPPPRPGMVGVLGRAGEVPGRPRSWDAPRRRPGTSRSASWDGPRHGTVRSRPVTGRVPRPSRDGAGPRTAVAAPGTGGFSILLNRALKLGCRAHCLISLHKCYQGASDDSEPISSAGNRGN